MTPSCQPSSEDVPRRAASPRPRLDGRHRLADDSLLDGLPRAVQVLELPASSRAVGSFVGEQQLERSRPPETPAALMRGARRNPTEVARRRRVDSRARIRHPARDGSSRPARGARPPRTRGSLGERADVSDRRQRYEVEETSDGRVVVSEQRTGQRVHDPGPAQVDARIRGRPGGDDGAVRQRLSRAVVVGDDDVQAELLRPTHLVDRSDAAIDGEHEVDAVLGEALDRLGCEAVSLLEATRQPPLHVRAELPQHEHRNGRRGDPVDVVVAVDADALSRRDRGADPSTATTMSPSVCGSCAGGSAARNPRAASGSSSPRRTSTVAVVSLTPSSSASASTRLQSHGRVVQRPSCIAARRYGRDRTASHRGGALKRPKLSIING